MCPQGPRTTKRTKAQNNQREAERDPTDLGFLFNRLCAYRLSIERCREGIWNRGKVPANLVGLLTSQPRLLEEMRLFALWVGVGTSYSYGKAEAFSMACVDSHAWDASLAYTARRERKHQLHVHRKQGLELYPTQVSV